MAARALNPGLGMAILRVVIAVIYMAHGIPKLLGGIPGTAEFFASLGIPAPTLAAWFIALLESVGGLLLLIGLFVVPVAVLLCIHMLVGIVLVHAPEGFYVIGPGQGGIAFNLLLIAGLLALIFVGPGIAAADRRRSGEGAAVDI